jgi:hypothetical protein
MYSGHYPRIFIAPKNARNAETKRQSGAEPIPLLALSALMTSAYTILGFLQELNPRPQLLKVLVYHSATSAADRGCVCVCRPPVTRGVTVKHAIPIDCD